MLIGQTVFVPASGTPGVIYYGPWMPRQGDKCSVVLQVLKASAASGWSLKCEIETKNAEDSDSSPTSIGDVTLSAVGTSNSLVTAGCLELVRFKFSGTGGGTDRWVHFRSNPILWQPN